MIVERFLTWMETAPQERKPAAASALGRAFLVSDLSAEETEAAQAAMTLLLDDPCERVRAALAGALCSSAQAPRHVMMSLACDAPEISMPVLARSPIFLDAELIDIAASAGSEQRIAIACRNPVSAALAAALAEIGEEEVCLALLMNDAAELPARVAHRIAQRHGGSAEIRSRLVACDSLLPETRIELIDKLGKTLRAAQIERSWMPPARIDATVQDQCDKAYIGLAANAFEADLPSIVAALIERGKVTPAFLLRAICLGNIKLFATALSALSSTPAGRVESVLDGRSRTAFRALYSKAGLPLAAFEVFDNLVASWRLHLNDPAVEGPNLSYLVTREALENYRGRQATDFDDVLVLLRRIAAETARDNGRHQARRIALEARERAQMLLEAPKVLSPEEQWPVADIAPDILSSFALAFAEELVDFEEEQAAATAAAEPDEPMREEAANDDIPVDFDAETSEARADVPVIDLGELEVARAA